MTAPGQYTPEDEVRYAELREQVEQVRREEQAAACERYGLLGRMFR